MDRRRIFIVGLMAVALIAALAAQPTGAVDAKCEAARGTLPNNPDILAFKQCAGNKPIVASCCRKLLPFAQYYDCLNHPAYKGEVDNFLKGVTSVDEVQKQCLG